MTRDETRGAEAARLAALHDLTGAVEERCWHDLAAENERLREALVEALSYFEEREDADHNGESYVSNEEMQIAQLIRTAIGETHAQEPFDHEGAPR